MDSQRRHFDDDILSATGSSYTVVDADLGKTIKVRVSFTDDAGSQESVIGLPPLQASITNDPASHDGATAFTFELSFSEEPTRGLSYKTLRDRAFTVTVGTIKEARRLEPPSNIGWRIRVQPSVSTDVVILLPATTDCTADGAICTRDGRMLSEEVSLTVPGPDSPAQIPNTPATGAPTIGGTPQVGQTLEAETSGIGDDDGLNNVSYDYQWIRNDGTSDADILRATGPGYTLAEADLGMTIRVRVSFTDDAGNGEELTSAATAPVVAAPTEIPTWSVSADVARVAEGGSATLTVAITNGRTFDSSQTISLAATGTAGSADYRLSATTLTLAEGATSATANVSATDDATVEGDETVILTASHGGESIGSATVTIPANDAPAWSVSADAAQIAEGDSATLTVAITNGNSFDSSQTISLAATGTASGADYDLPESITLPAGHASVTANVSATDDATVEGDETVILTASHGGQSIGSATVTIPANDAPAWSVSADAAQVAEGDSATLTVAITNGNTFDSSQTISLAATGTASGPDYDLPESITLPAGHASVTAKVSATDDATVEGDETVILTASHGGRSIGSATVTIPANDAPLSTDASLSSLALSDIDIGTFSSETTAYSASVEYDLSTTTVTAVAGDDGASVVITDSNGSTDGTSRDVSLSAGDNEITLTVTAEDGDTKRVYTVTVTRAEPDVAWGERLPDLDIALDSDAGPTGLWANDTSMWVITDWFAGRVQVYARSDGAKQEGRGFTLADWSGFAVAMWSNGDTLWVADFTGWVLAYRLSDGVREPDRDLDRSILREAGNRNPTGLWSDGTVMWVADGRESKVFAYRLSDGSRESAREFQLTGSGGGSISPAGLWSNGETLLVSTGQESSDVLAYRLSDGSRQAARNIDTIAANTRGIWSDGETLWVVDDQKKRIYAYAVPGLGSGP